MTWDHADAVRRLESVAAAFDRPTAATIVEEITAHLRRAEDTFPERPARTALAALRAKRWFDLLERLADAFIQSGQGAPQVRRQYAQALIDQGRLTAALAVLEALVADTAAIPAEHAEARGLVGRLFKQRYVEAGSPPTARSRAHLERAIAAYHEVYRGAPSVHLWHGINAVALVRRAERDGVAVAGAPDAAAVAADILGVLEVRESAGKLPPWDLATAAEACLALGRSKEALDWVAEYVKPETGADAFELASTLRQWTEVWQLDATSEPGASLLPVLRSQLLQREGGRVELAPRELAREDRQQVDASTLQKVLGNDGVVTLQWYRTGLERCRAVAKVETVSGEGFGTGFLVRGKDVHESLEDELVLLTNAHVVSDDPEVKDALRPEEAVVVFEALEEAGAAPRHRIARLLWTSPPGRLDATLVTLDPPCADLEPYPLARSIPDADGKLRVYILGHPGGRTLSFSLHDNLLLDSDDPWLHYRAPTEGGSSGSPVFNHHWRLVGLHHAGGLAMRRLRGQPGTYAANEGIWIQAILKRIAEEGLRG